MRSFLLSLMTLLIACQTLSAGTLTSVVVNPDKIPIQGAVIESNMPSINALTGSDGSFTLIWKEGGETITKLTFSASGYESRQINVSELTDTIMLDYLYYKGKDIIVTADRVSGEVATIAFDNYSQDEIKRDYTMAEFPLLLESTPNLYSYSDAGSSSGYSYIKIRGFDDKRIVTYINGVPLNDPEDHATYFVDLPDFASTVSDIQIQRGVGNSLYGDASFGGSINIVSNSFNRLRKTTLTGGYGAYFTEDDNPPVFSRQTVEYSSGLIGGQWVFSGRYSRMRNDGYRYNSWYDGWAYYLSVARLDPNMSTELMLYGGPMNMHLSYYGTARGDLASDRRTNYLTYKNETDNFNQPHYQIHNIYRLNDRTVLNNTVYHIRGKGYYEQFKDDRDYFEYNIDPTLTDGAISGDLVRQQWVVKNQTGLTSRLDIEHDRGRHTLGGSFYYFDSEHWGQVVWAEHIDGPLDPRHKYYVYYGVKKVASLYAQEQYNLTERLNAQATAQLRYQRYDFNQVKMGAFKGFIYDLDYLFFSPRLGINYSLTDQVNLFANFSVASRTPTDAAIYDANDPYILPSLEIESMTVSPEDDTSYVFGDPTAQSERVYDFELGANYRGARWQGSLNLFWMDFKDEIIPLGGLNPNNGLAITVNADRSVHAGVELSLSYFPIDNFSIQSNFAYNYNRVKKYSSEFGYSLDSAGNSYDESVIIDFADKKIVNFPDYLGNIILDYKWSHLRLTWRNRFVGRQYTELLNIESLSIDPFYSASLSASYTLTDFMRMGNLTFSVHIDNLFNSKYETAGYGGNYAYRVENENVVVDGWAEYFVNAVRSIYGQIQLEIF